MTRKILALLLCVMLCAVMTVQVAAQAPDADTLIDEADLLTATQEATALDRLTRLSHTYQMQIAVVTLSYVDFWDMDVYTERVYEDMEYGFGSGYDGVLLLISMDPREYRILSNGKAADAISPEDIDDISDQLQPLLKSGDYHGAVAEFIDRCQYYLDGYTNGFPFDWGKYVLIGLGIGLLVGVITAFVLKGQLKTVRRQPHADMYLKSGSLEITLANDLYLYRTVSRVARQQNNNNRSGGSGGGSRNIGGGSF